MTDKLYYIRDGAVYEVPATRDRLMCVTPIFYAKRIDALIAAKQQIERDVQKGVDRLISLEKEIFDAR